MSPIAAVLQSTLFSPSTIFFVRVGSENLGVIAGVFPLTSRILALNTLPFSFNVLSSLIRYQPSSRPVLVYVSPAFSNSIPTVVGRILVSLNIFAKF